MSEPVTPETVIALIQEVSAGYAQQILAERRAAAPDAERLETLKAKLAQCAADQQAVQTAGEEDVAAIAARYAAEAQELGEE